MKQVSTFFSFILSCALYAQGSYIIPQEYISNSIYTIYIDAEKASDSTLLAGLDAYLKADTNRYEDVYIWLWFPNTPVGVGGNGEWANSNPLLKMTHVSGMLFSFSFRVEWLFNITSSDFSERRLSFVAKLKDGSKDGYPFEPKTQDQTIYLWKVAVDPALSEGIQLYPIPAREQITVVHPKPGLAFDVFDLSGKQILSAENPFQTETTIDTHTWQPGMYLLSYPGTGLKRHFMVE